MAVVTGVVPMGVALSLKAVRIVADTVVVMPMVVIVTVSFGLPASLCGRCLDGWSVGYDVQRDRQQERRRRDRGERQSDPIEANCEPHAAGMP
jgi:hypothetical protein